MIGVELLYGANIQALAAYADAVVALKSAAYAQELQIAADKQKQDFLAQLAQTQDQQAQQQPDPATQV